MVFVSHPFGYRADIELRLEELSVPLRMERMVRFFFQSMTKYDVFHFNFGGSLLSNFRFPFLPDVGLLKSAGKKVFISYQGCDGRLKSSARCQFEHSACQSGECGNTWCNWAIDLIRRRRARVFSRKADAIFCLNPDLCRFVRRGVFLPYANVNIRQWFPEAASQSRRGKEVVVLHAPSDRRIKGTSYIENALGRIQVLHPNVVLDLLEGVPHAQVRDRMKKADIVIDQLLVGWYGGIGVEAMALGKPVISYIREEDLRFVPAGMARDLPVVNANIQNLERVVTELIQDEPARKVLGERGRAYVEKWHDPLKIAQTTLAFYQGSGSTVLEHSSLQSKAI